MAKCRECGKGKLKILGTGGFGDTVEVECQNPKCGEIYEVEPDGLGEGGLEWVAAKMMGEVA
jgi:ssDNA-binding Zn-finger/Zn-ribbon topoisomerase 1